MLAPRASELEHFQIKVAPSLKLLSQPGEAPPEDASSGFVIEYAGLNGNLPLQYQNEVSLWTGALPNPAVPPLEVQPVPTNLQRGNVKFNSSLGVAPCCLTYQVGAGPARMCAMVQVNVAQGPMLPMYVSIQLREVGESSLKIQYSTLAGYLPKTNGNWIGVWQGFATPYTAPEPLARAGIESDFTQGEVTITAQLSNDFDYTAIYFVGPQKTMAAALMYFRVTSSPAGPQGAATSSRPGTEENKP